LARIPGFVFLDIHLPGEDGYTLADTLRIKCGLKNVQMWALSGDVDEKSADVVPEALPHSKAAHAESCPSINRPRLTTGGFV